MTSALWWRLSTALRGPGEPAIPLADALEALGDTGRVSTYTDEVPVDSIVGSVLRSDDFDADMRLRNPRLRARWEATQELFRQGSHPPPVDLVRLGEVFFVYDGHHRVSVARAMGWTHLPARVSHRCTVAYAMCCLTVAHLAGKRAEQEFLQQVRVPEDATKDLWLDDPADWERLAADATQWAARHPDDVGTCPDAHALGGAWWAQQVQPTIARIRDGGGDACLADVQLYVTALAARDHLDAQTRARTTYDPAACCATG